MRKITVLIADDHNIVRQGLKHLLEMAPDIEVVGEADNGEAAVRQAKALKPNVVLLDIAMPVKNGIEAAREIRKDSPSAKILILSTYHEEQEVQQAVEAGIAGFMMKESAGAELLNAVRDINKGHSFFSPPIAWRMLRQTRNAYRSNADGSLQTLTARELEVLKLIASGSLNKQTASHLAISMKSVEKHRQSLMEKLHIRDAAMLTRYAISKGLVPCERRSLVALAAAATPAPSAAR